MVWIEKEGCMLYVQIDEFWISLRIRKKRDRILDNRVEKLREVKKGMDERIDKKSSTA